MDRQSWLWGRTSSDKSVEETESSGSVSSYSERYSEEQEPLRFSYVNASPNYAHSPKVLSKITAYDSNETIKSLNEKLSAALLSINAKEELVRQHVKVTEEAVSGWEKAEADAASLKKQFEVVVQKNLALESRASNLDGALKECVRQLRKSREEQELKVNEALINKTKEWDNEKFDLQTQIIELQAKLEVKSETVSSIDHQLHQKLKGLEKEKSSLQIELLARTDELRLRTLERDLSTQAAEIASKQHLESIKKVTKLETECRNLQAASRKSFALDNHIKLSYDDQKLIPSLVCVESLTDCQSDNGEQLGSLDNEPSCSDSWGPSLILEFDQFKNDKPIMGKLAASTTEIDLMNDFLEMERLASLPEPGCASSSVDINVDSDISFTRVATSKVIVEDMCREVDEFELTIAKLESEKVELDMALSEARNQLKFYSDQLTIADDKLIKVQQELSATNVSKPICDTQAVDKRKELKSQLESAQLEIIQLNEKVSLLEGKVEEVNELHVKVNTLESKIKEEEAISVKLTTNMEIVEANRMKLSTRLESANAESVKQDARIRLLEEEVEQERKLSAKLVVECQHLTEIKAEAEACMEAKNNVLDSQFRSAHLEIQKLQDEASSLRQEVDEEKSKYAQIAAQCQVLEDEISRMKQDDELQGSLTLDAMLKLKKEKRIVMASEKFAACQKTLNSLNQQLKSLSNFENLMVEFEMPSCYMDLPNLTGLSAKENAILPKQNYT